MNRARAKKLKTAKKTTKKANNKHCKIVIINLIAGISDSLLPKFVCNNDENGINLLSNDKQAAISQ